MREWLNRSVWEIKVSQAYQITNRLMHLFQYIHLNPGLASIESSVEKTGHLGCKKRIGACADLWHHTIPLEVKQDLNDKGLTGDKPVPCYLGQRHVPTSWSLYSQCFEQDHGWDRASCILLCQSHQIFWLFGRMISTTSHWNTYCPISSNCLFLSWHVIKPSEIHVWIIFSFWIS